MADPRRDMQALTSACRRIAGGFAAADSPRSVALAERAFIGELVLVFRHLHAFALAELRRRSGTDPFLRDRRDRLDEIAHDAVTPLWERVRLDGPQKIVRTVRRALDRIDPRDDIAIFRYMRGTATRRVANAIRKLRRAETPAYARTRDAVTSYVARSRMYITSDGVVIRTPADGDRTPGSARMASLDDILELCLGRRPRPAKASAAVDRVFKALEECGHLLPRLPVSTLVAGVFHLISHRYAPLATPDGTHDPRQLLIERRLVEAVDRAMGEVSKTYRWGDRPQRVKRAYIEAGRDFLNDLAFRGDPAGSHYEYLSVHLAPLTRTEYAAYKGSFQYFLQSLARAYRKHTRDARGKDR